jgi:hypothetical protein
MHVKNGKTKYNKHSKSCISKYLINKYLSHTYKGLAHKINHCKFNLNTDIEKNPGPSTVINPSKTICAHYSQGNMTLFGLNAGRQCVAMSLCALIYNKHRLSITSSVDLENIMNVGNELYSVLSRLYNQDFVINRIA